MSNCMSFISKKCRCSIAVVILVQSALVLLFLLYLFYQAGESLLVLNDHFLLIGEMRPDYLYSQVWYDDLGSANSISSQILLLDRVLYHFLFKISEDYIFIQRLKLSITMLLYFNISLYGWYRLGRVLVGKVDWKNLCIASFFYSVNLFAIIFWNTGIFFSTQQAIAYAILPLAFTLFFKTIIKGDGGYLSFVKLAIVSFLVSLVSYIAYIYIFIILIFFFVYVSIYRINFWDCLSRMVKAVIVFVPLALFQYPIFYQMLSGATTLVNSDHIANGGMAGALKGGLLYQMQMWCWWPIYNQWYPRSILSFDNYIMSWPVAASVLLLLALIVFIRRKGEGKDFVVPFLCVFLFCLFFAKGPQAPFAKLFDIFMSYIPLAKIVRTPDNKFAIGSVFALSSLLLLSHFEKKHLIIVCVLLAVPSFPFFTAEAILGRDGNNCADRRVVLPVEYEELAVFLNNNYDGSEGYVLPVPFEGWGQYRLSNAPRDSLFGQDMLSKMIRNPFLFYNVNGGMNSDIFKRLRAARTDFMGLKKFVSENPVKYLLFRKDVVGYTDYLPYLKKMRENFDLTFSNRMFSLFVVKSFRGLISEEYQEVSPMLFHVRIDRNEHMPQVQLFTNESPFWVMAKVYPETIIKIKDNSFFGLFRRQMYLLSVVLNDKILKKVPGGEYNKWLIEDEVDMDRLFIVFNKLNLYANISNMIAISFLFLYVCWVFVCFSVGGSVLVQKRQNIISVGGCSND